MNNNDNQFANRFCWFVSPWWLCWSLLCCWWIPCLWWVFMISSHQTIYQCFRSSPGTNASQWYSLCSDMALNGWNSDLFSKAYDVAAQARRRWLSPAWEWAKAFSKEWRAMMENVPQGNAGHESIWDSHNYAVEIRHAKDGVQILCVFGQVTPPILGYMCHLSADIASFCRQMFRCQVAVEVSNCCDLCLVGTHCVILALPPRSRGSQARCTKKRIVYPAIPSIVFFDYFPSLLLSDG